MNDKKMREKFFMNLFRRGCFGKWNCLMKEGQEYFHTCPHSEECREARGRKETLR